DIKSDTEFAQEEAEAAFGGGDDEEFTGRCAAVLANGKRCPNAAVPGSRFCGIPAHRELAEREARGEDVSDSVVQPTVSEAEEGTEEEGVDAEESREEPLELEQPVEALADSAGTAQQEAEPEA